MGCCHIFQGLHLSRRRVISSDRLTAMTVSIINPFPLLPQDIERLILETLALQDVKIALDLAVLSRQTKLWIEPVIYETVVIKSTMRIKRFINLIQNSNKPPNFFDVHVKNLFIYDSALDTNLSGDDISSIIQSCKSIVFLALWINQSGNFTLDFPQPHIMIPGGSLFRLSTWASSLAHGMSHHLYRNLTHFEVIVGRNAAQRKHHGWDSYKPLQSLARLTHLSIREVDPRPVPGMHDEIIPYLPKSVKIFVIRVHDHHVLEKNWLVYQSDRRMVILVYNDEKQYGDVAPFIVGKFSWTGAVKDWGFLPAGYPGGIWDLAERALETRLRHLEETESKAEVKASP